MKKYIILLLVIIVALPVYGQKRELAITVYNHNLAVVKDVREIDLQKGIIELKYQEVAAAIDPTSVHFKSLTAPDKVAIIYPRIATTTSPTSILLVAVIRLDSTVNSRSTASCGLFVCDTAFARTVNSFVSVRSIDVV